MHCVRRSGECGHQAVRGVSGALACASSLTALVRGRLSPKRADPRLPVGENSEPLAGRDPAPLLSVVNGDFEKSRTRTLLSHLEQVP